MKTTTKLFLVISCFLCAMNTFAQEEKEVKQLLFTQYDNPIDDTMPDSIPQYVRNYSFNEKDNNWYVIDVFLGNKKREGYTILHPSVGITGRFEASVIEVSGDTLISTGDYDNTVKVGEWTDYVQRKVIGKSFYDQEGKKTGNWKTWNRATGQIETDENFANDELNGKCSYYFEDGKLSEEEVYENGELISYKQFDKDGNIINTSKEVFAYTDEMPYFKGGINEMVGFLGNNIIYPNEELQDGIQGTVVVEFIMKSNGQMTDFKVVRPISPALDREALRITKLMQGKWVPGKMDNRKVDVRFRLPVKFQIQKEERPRY